MRESYKLTCIKKTETGKEQTFSRKIVRMTQKGQKQEGMSYGEVRAVCGYVTPSTE